MMMVMVVVVGMVVVMRWLNHVLTSVFFRHWSHLAPMSWSPRTTAARGSSTRSSVPENMVCHCHHDYMISIMITSRNWLISNSKSPSGFGPLDVDAVGEGGQEGAGVLQLHLGDHGDGNNGNGKDGDKEDVVEITFVFCLTSSSNFSPSLSRSISKVSAPLINSSFFA